MWLITSCFGRRDNFNKYSSSITPVGHMDLNKSGKYDKERSMGAPILKTISAVAIAAILTFVTASILSVMAPITFIAALALGITVGVVAAAISVTALSKFKLTDIY